MKSAFLAGLFLLLSGCLHAPLLPARPPAANITAFVFAGRLAIRQGEARHHVKIDWRHDAARDEILLATPLGQGVAEIVRDGDGARLTLSDRREFAAADWNELAERVFGFRLPLDSAPRWLVGDDGANGDWRIAIVERESDATAALPSLIELERDDIQVRLKIDEWNEVR